jgi:hypothetical protein
MTGASKEKLLTEVPRSPETVMLKLLLLPEL